MQLSDFDLPIPHALVAQQPLVKRDHARLLVYNRAKDTIYHRLFKDIGEYLLPGDCLVRNNTKVFPARIFGKKITGGKVELLLVRSIDASHWECLVKPWLPNESIILFDSQINGKVVDRTPEGRYIVKIDHPLHFARFISHKGVMPLPPYIKRKDISASIRKKDNAFYQTVYAKHDGSIAAPTAGLHFTNKLLHALEKKEVSLVDVVLHVGIGTF
jgi:S-adenosylmethionine:tRNA ribosyltransferase-isomerase